MSLEDEKKHKKKHFERNLCCIAC